MQKEPTKKAAGKRNVGANPPRKLSRAEKKQIAEVIRQAKGDGKAHTAQQTIPYITMYPDGICKVTDKKYSILAKQLNISPQQMKYVTHTEAGEGLIFYGNVVLPFVDRFPKDTELYRVMTTKPEEVSKA